MYPAWLLYSAFYSIIAVWAGVIIAGILLHQYHEETGERWWAPLTIPYCIVWVAWGNYWIRRRKYGLQPSKPLMAV